MSSKVHRTPRPSPVPLPGPAPEHSGLEDAKDSLFVGGIQPQGLESVGVFPGRGRATAADINALLAEFESRLPQLGSKTPLSLPKTGAFALARDIYRQNDLSHILRSLALESVRDVFYFVCGVCWRLFVNTEDLPRRVGIFFVVYLLYHSQHPQRCDVPVDVVVMEALAVMREECERRQVLLECPEVLHRLCAQGAFSIGIRATTRDLFFNVHGELGERSETPSKKPASMSSVGNMQAGRLRIAGQDGDDEVDPASQHSLSAAVGSRDSSKPDLSLGNVLQNGQHIHASLGAGPGAIERQVRDMGKGLERYRQETPPELLELPGEAELQEMPRKKVKRGKGFRSKRWEIYQSPSPEHSEGEGGSGFVLQNPGAGRVSDHQTKAMGSAEVLRRLKAQRERLAKPLASPSEAAGQRRAAPPSSSGTFPNSSALATAEKDAERPRSASERADEDRQQAWEEEREGDPPEQEDASSDGSRRPTRMQGAESEWEAAGTEWEAISGSSCEDESDAGG